MCDEQQSADSLTEYEAWTANAPHMETATGCLESIENGGEIMKFSTGLLTLLLPAMAIGQNYQGMSEQDMQNMMERMQEMQTCMQGIDQSRMDALEQQAKEMEAEVKSLCAKGKRDAAQGRAMAFSRQMANDPDVQEIKKCGDSMKGVMPTMAQIDRPERSGVHICDE